MILPGTNRSRLLEATLVETRCDAGQTSVTDLGWQEPHRRVNGSCPRRCKSGALASLAPVSTRLDSNLTSFFSLSLSLHHPPAMPDARQAQSHPAFPARQLRRRPGYTTHCKAPTGGWQKWCHYPLGRRISEKRKPPLCQSLTRDESPLPTVCSRKSRSRNTISITCHMPQVDYDAVSLP